MGRKVGLGLAALAIVGVVLFALLGTNVVRSEGEARFEPGPNGLNSLFLTGPYGWSCMEYTKTMGASGAMEVAGQSRGDCALLGAVELTSNEYPNSGSAAVPLDQPTMVYQNEAKTYEVYVLISKDPARLQQLGVN